mmetsp:Transcript_10757/g.17825  ORF Transcript_10757/g.17825 Transcript_10757/m.17825 type:complete len:355 (-) Transcript_10757:74-1138(-)
MRSNVQVGHEETDVASSSLFPRFSRILSSTFGASSHTETLLSHTTQVANNRSPGSIGHARFIAEPEAEPEELVEVAREHESVEIRERERITDRACRTCCFLLVAFLLIAPVLVCMGICLCCCAMHFAGWLISWWLIGCNHHQLLRRWLLLFQMLSLAEAWFASLLRGRLQRIREAFDTRVGPGNARSIRACYAFMSLGLKVLWCIRTHKLVAHVGHQKGCGESLPWFMQWYCRVLLLQLLVVEPFVRLAMGIVAWAASHGLLSTTRGAKPGTLEAMQVVDYDAELFADPDDPADSRPQRECCFCLEEYDADTAIMKTPCQHMMHRDCFARWLQTSHFCPICRADVEDISRSAQV